MQPGPPPIAPPGLMGPMVGSTGMGAAYGQAYSQADAQNRYGTHLAGVRTADFVGNTALPAAVTAGLGISAFAAPIMAKQSGWVRTLGNLGNAIDPMEYMGSLAKFGFNMGGGAQALNTFTNAAGVMARARALPALAGAGAMGLGAALLPLAAAGIATEGVIKAGSHFAQGAQEQFTGAALMKTIGSQFGASSGSGVGVGKLLGETGRDVGKNVSEMADMVRDMDQMKLFQTTRSVQEFKERFSEIMDTVKQVATTMQSSVDDALKMVGEMKTQGFYTASDIKAASLRQKATSSASGLSLGQLNQAGRFGAQYSRALGMRGRFGSEFAQTQTAAVARAVREGMMSEEDVMEAGGVEQVGASLAATQMRFLRSSRGRMMIANMLGEGSQMDMGRVNRMLSGDSTLEGMVTGAAGRGLGVLRMAGTSEARENAMPYAGMGMVSIAAAQSRQLHGGYSQQGILRMLGTMGLGRRDARLMLQQTMAMPGMLEEQAEAEYTAAQRALFSEESNYHSLGSGISRYLYDKSGTGFSPRGSLLRLREEGRTAGAYGRQAFDTVSRVFGSPVETSGGGSTDLALANDYAARMQRYAGDGNGEVDPMSSKFQATNLGANLSLGLVSDVAAEHIGGVASYLSGSESVGNALKAFASPDWMKTGRLRGPPGYRERVRTEAREFTMGATDASNAGVPVMDLGEGRYITQNQLEAYEKADREAGRITERQRGDLKYLTQGSDNALADARNVILGAGMKTSQSLDPNLGEDARRAYDLALASDIIGGVAGTKEGLLGTTTPEEYSKNASARQGLISRLSEEGASSEYLSRKSKGIGTLDSERKRFSGDMDVLLGKMGISDVGPGAALRNALAEDESTRGVFKDVMLALNAEGSEQRDLLRKAMQGAEGLDSDAGKEIMSLLNRVKSPRAMAALLAELEGGVSDSAFESMERYGFVQHRGRSANRIGSKITRLRDKGKLGAAGGHASRVLALANAQDDVGEFHRISSQLGADILGDGQITKEESDMLASVFGNQGGNFEAVVNKLVAGDADLIKARDLDLDPSDMKGKSHEERMKLVAAALIKKGQTDIAGYSTASGKEIGEVRAEYVQANTRFVVAVNRFVGNLKEAGVGGDWTAFDLTDLEDG